MPFTLDKAHSILTANITKDTCIGLSTTTPNSDGSNFTEPNPVLGYERTRFNDSYYSEIKGQISNGKGIIFFNETLGSWGTVTHFGLFTQKEGGAPFFYGELIDDSGNPTTVPIPAANYVPIFRKNQLKIALDREIV